MKVRQAMSFDFTKLPQIMQNKSVRNREENKRVKSKIRVSMDNINDVYNEHCGYSKRFHNYDTPQSRIKKLLKECSNINTSHLHTRKSSNEDIVPLRISLTNTRKLPSSTKSSPKKERMSETIRNKYLKIFVNESYIQMNDDKSNTSVSRSSAPYTPSLSPLRKDIALPEVSNEPSSNKASNTIQSILLKNIKSRKRYKKHCSMAFKNPETTNLSFLQQYLRYIMRRGMEEPIRKKYMEYLKYNNEKMLGQDFLPRMQNDIVLRRLNKSVS